MTLSRISMRVSLVVTVLAIGAFGLAVTLLTSQVYRDQVQEERRAALAADLQLRHDAYRQERIDEASVFHLALRFDPRWELIWRFASPPELERHVERYVRHYRDANSGSHLLRVNLLDEHQGRMISVSAGGRDATPAGSVSCAPFRQSADGAAAGSAKAVAGPCLVANQPVYAVRLPIWGAGRKGFLELVTDWQSGLRDLEQPLGGPLRLSQTGGSAIYQSPRWMLLDAAPGLVQAELAVNGLAGPAGNLRLEVRRDNSALDAVYDRRRFTTLLLAAICLVIMCYVGLRVLDKTAIVPMHALTARLRAMLDDRHHLGQPVNVGGNAEVVELEEGFNDMTRRLKELHDNLERMAFSDALTGLPNRAVFYDRLQQQILTARREHKSFALFIMDIDRFKDINDTLGHPVGDALLRQVSERLRERLRESDTVARLGGDEFAVLLPSVERQHAAMAARMLLQALRVPFEIDEHRLDIGTSIGIVLYPDHGESADILVQRADVAMYVAKHAGGGYAVYETEHDRGASQRLTLMAELRRAVEQEQFELHYQPKIDLGTGRVMGVEALMRWRHPRDGLILPEVFIPLLEQSGQIRALTPWLLNEVLGFGRRLQREGLSVMLSMNLSVRDLQDSTLIDTLAEQLQTHQADPSMCEFEITESAVMSEPARAIEALNRLAEVGFRLAIDDFGTGYSSFAYLKKLPVHTLKIDKSFVLGMARDDSDDSIVRASIELAHSLNLKIVAEGVEDAETLKRLRQHGCDIAQGHHICRALPGEELVTWLRQSSWGLGGDSPGHVSVA
jgi:diguanylate cyclase (GGDEF)-like protein